jgi:hypothetical protein
MGADLVASVAASAAPERMFCSAVARWLCVRVDYLSTLADTASAQSASQLLVEVLADWLGHCCYSPAARRPRAV